MTAGILLIYEKTGAHSLEAARCGACAWRSAATAAPLAFFQHPALGVKKPATPGGRISLLVELARRA